MDYTMDYKAMDYTSMATVVATAVATEEGGAALEKKAACGNALVGVT